MDQLFERLERLVKSWVNSATGVEGSGIFGSREPFSDPDLADAWEELEQFLNPDREQRQRADRTSHGPFEETTGQQSRWHESAGGSRRFTEDPRFAQERRAVEEAYRFLGLPPYAPFAEVKSRYKELLKQHHPDRHTHEPEALRRATEMSARINNAYQLIETWEEARRRGR
ncbi:MAG: J domain-containing protein [Spirochaetales bacterium]|nr:J domain-containing protein [Spirochaetales bacterium]